MRKPVYAICEQQRRISDCASAQFDQHFCCSVVRCLDSLVPLVSISKISSYHLASMAVQASLCLIWSKTLKTYCLMTGLVYSIVVFV